GRHVVREFTEKGHEVIVISRSGKKGDLTWNNLHDHLDMLNGLDAWVNLAGETINQRWTKYAKFKILESRLYVTNKVAETVEKLTIKPKVVINGSGMSIYGT